MSSSYAFIFTYYIESKTRKGETLGWKVISITAQNTESLYFATMPVDSVLVQLINANVDHARDIRKFFLTTQEWSTVSQGLS